MKRRLLITTAVAFVLCEVGFTHVEDANIWNTRAINYYSQGAYIQAIECFLEEISIYERINGKEHLDYLRRFAHFGG